MADRSELYQSAPTKSANGTDCEQSDLDLHCLVKPICPGPSCSKLTTSLVNVSLKFQTLIFQICQYFLLNKCVKLLHCKSFSHFFNKKNSVYLVIKS